MTTKTKDVFPSNTWCSYPWVHSYQGSRYERKLCCISDDIPNHDKTPTSEFWNSEYMQSVRKKMMSGEKVSACSSCYRNEKLGIRSLREESNADVIRYSEDPEKAIKDLVGECSSYNGFHDKEPVYFDYRTIHCNLQCISCGDVYSSTWMQTNKKMWGKEPTFKPDAAYEKNMAKEMIDGIENKSLDNIYWAGGEPMMASLHWDVIEKMVELLPRPEYNQYVKNIKMHYNTNLTRLKWKNKSIPKMLEPFQPSIQASLDGCFETIEYTRDGCTWKDIENNWKEYHSVLNKNQQMGVATVLSAPVLFDIDRYINFFGPYDPFLHPHYMYTRLDDVSACPGFLDLRWYPKDIFYDTVEKAKREMIASGMRNSEKWVQVLNAYEKEYKDKVVTEDELRILKGSQQYRELFLNVPRRLDELYDITNPAAAEWIRSLEPEYLEGIMPLRLANSQTHEVPTTPIRIIGNRNFNELEKK